MATRCFSPPLSARGSSGAIGTTALNATIDANVSSNAWNVSELPSDRGSVSGDRATSLFQFRPAMDATLRWSK